MRYLSSIARNSVFSIVALFMGIALIGARPAGAEPVIQGYTSDSALPKGMVVALAKDSKTKVQPANPNELTKLYGVVVDPNDAPVTLTSDGQQVFVATQGQYQVLVSAQNGPIKANDYISMSSSKGTAARATEKQTRVLGRAVESFDGKTNVISGSGDVALGRIVINLNIGKNPNQKSDKNFLPEFLSKTAEAVAGKPVAPARIYSGIVLLIISGFISGSLIYAGVRNAIISIGRNPLGKKKISRGLLQVLLISLIIFILGIFGVYLLVKL